MAENVMLVVGTRKGVFLLDSDAGRRSWEMRGPFCDCWPSNHAIYGQESGTIFAAAVSPWYGPVVWRSGDLGQTWQQSSEGLTYGDGGPALAAPWSLAVAGNTVYAGTEPAGLFRSRDGGQTWCEVEALRKHPHAEAWEPGGAGLILHSIVPDPASPDSLSVAISTGGTYHTDDGGDSWEARNQGVRADFSPIPNPEFGQCVHHLERAADGKTLYQQNHCGVYRSDDGGKSWDEITAGLPSEFGFPMAAHPRDPGTVYVIPLNGADKGRYVPEAEGAVWRSRDRGESWQRLTCGLPRPAYYGVLRQAMAVDTLDSAGVYFGTSTGQLYASRDEGETWSEIANYLPPITSVEAAVVER